jgi:hypothetical protein
MSYFKRTPIEIPALRRAALGNACVRCYAPNSVGGHYTGIRQHDLGKGFGQKCDDHCIADLCPECHAYFDQPDAHKSVERSEEFLFLILLTLRRRIAEGVLTVGKQPKRAMG